MSRPTAARWSREPIYLAYLAISIASLWAYAWCDGRATQTHIVPQRRPGSRSMLVIERQRYRVQVASNDSTWGT